jgi:predicted nucleic acid-binding protein
LASEIGRAIGRLRAGRPRKPLAYRPADTLPFLDLAKPLPRNLLLDGTVYVDELQGRLPRDAETLLRAATLWHSPVTAAKLAIGIGHLDPRHAETKRAIAAITESIERRPVHRSLAPDSDIWVEAGIAAGMLARSQDHAAADRGRVLNDALLLFTAARHGCTLLTRDVRDFDLLLQIAPAAQVLFYARSSRAASGSVSNF